MAKTLPISDVKTRLPELVSGVEEREEEVVVTRKGKPAAVLVNYSEYERLKESLDVLSDPALMSQIRRSRRFYAKGGKGVSFEELFGEPLQPARNASANGRLPARHRASRFRGHPPSSSRFEA